MIELQTFKGIEEKVGHVLNKMVSITMVENCVDARIISSISDRHCKFVCHFALIALLNKVFEHEPFSSNLHNAIQSP